MVKKKNNDNEKKIDHYTHDDKERINNPPVGLVNSETDHLNGKKTYKHDPYIDPELNWAGKAEGTSFEIDTVSLHVHERIDPLTIIENVKKEKETSFDLFPDFEQNVPLREAVEFYKHRHSWSNRLVAGDSLLVMNSLLEKEGMAGKVQMIYIDPPYGIKYGSNFQPFVNKRDVKDNKDEDLTQEPETIKAFRDTWELGIHSYLSYLRDRLLLARELLTDSGSVFVQISDENVHHVREIMDELFGRDNFVSNIILRKSGSQTTGLIPAIFDYIVWYANDKSKIKYNPLYTSKKIGINETEFNQLINNNGDFRTMTYEEKMNVIIPEGYKIFKSTDLNSRSGSLTTSQSFYYKGKEYYPRKGAGWRTNIEGLKKLEKANRLISTNNTLRYVHYFDDYPYSYLSNIWDDLMGASDLFYVVQTNEKAIKRCLLMTTDPGDLVFDPTCGSGTTAYVAEQWGRRWITCDTSRVAITLAKQRLMTAVYDYYKLSHEKEGVSSGFEYKTVPHITLKSIANDEPPAKEILYDQPLVETKKKRVTGPFTVEAVPSQRVRSLDDISTQPGVQSDEFTADNSIARQGETVNQNDWIDELRAAGVRGKGGQKMEFARMEIMGGARWLHAGGETKEGEKVAVSFGPEYAPLEQRQVELAIQEAQNLVPKPSIIIFASFQFDPEAAKDIDELKWPGVSVLKVQMNTDLLTSDLKKKRSNNESFWLIGQPDVEMKKKGDKYVVTVKGFDYYNTRTGQIESGDTSKIALWELDTDYDGRSLYPRQIFFIMEPGSEQLEKLSRNLKGFVNEELIEKFFGTTSLPFSPGKYKQVAVKIIDDRGIESMKILRIKDE
jgi:adenine-specific DNA-methyltransferase